MRMTMYLMLPNALLLTTLLRCAGSVLPSILFMLLVTRTRKCIYSLSTELYFVSYLYPIVLGGY
jgi:hypothetical protein